MSRVIARVAAVVVLAAAVAGAGEAKKPEPAKPAPTAHKVRQAPFKIEVKLNGTLEAARTVELSLAPKAWSVLQVAKAVEPGTRVKKGEPVVWFDLEKIDEAVRKAELDEEIGALAFQQAEEGYRAAQKLVPLDLAAAERTHERFDVDFKHYTDFELPYSKKTAKYAIDAAEFSLEYAREELEQLEKMYKEDDLTEESEEIILKRARRAVIRAELNVEGARDRFDRTMKHTIPRNDVDMKDKATRHAIDYARSEIALPLQVKQKRLEFEKAKRARQEAVEKLAKLKGDREAMTVKAPTDGIVYYGQCTRGQWNSATVAPLLRTGAGMKPNVVFATIVQPRPLFVRIDVPETELHQLKPGLAADAIPAGFPEVKLAAKLESVSLVPLKAGTFDGKLSVSASRAASAVMPGMTCSLTIKVYENAKALAVPAGAVFPDAADKAKRVVYVVGKDGKPAKRAVKVGRKSGNQVEILDGLKAGESVSLTKPAATK